MTPVSPGSELALTNDGYAAGMLSAKAGQVALPMFFTAARFPELRIFPVAAVVIVVRMVAIEGKASYTAMAAVKAGLTWSP